MENRKDANIIKITSVDHLNQLTNEGYEIENMVFQFQNNSSKVTLTLIKDGIKIIADANDIDEYALHLVPLYDPSKKDIRMIWIPDTELYWNFESTLVDLLENSFNNNSTYSIFNNQIPSSDIYFELVNCISKVKSKKDTGKKLSSIYSSVFIVNKKDGKVSSEIHQKDLLNLKQIHTLLEHSKKLDNSISVSFTILHQKLNPKSNEILIAIIVYDMKNRQTLAINFQNFTLKPFNNEIDEITKKLFDNTINSNLEVKTILSVPLDSHLFTITPWIIYSNLSSIRVSEEKNLKQYAITIPEFFMFGFSEFLENETTFDYHYFSNNKRGHATCLLNFNNYDGNKIKYNMRFDQSPGEPLVHIDFSFYDGSERKLISHWPLDLEDVYKFNQKLFMVMMSAGLFDANFNTLLDKGLKGIQNLIKNNPAFSYPLVFIWRIETWISWLNDNKKGYEILKKLYYLTSLDEDEKEFLVKIMKETQIGQYSLIEKNENGEISLNAYGYIVLIRFLRDQTNLSVTI